MLFSFWLKPRLYTALDYSSSRSENHLQLSRTETNYGNWVKQGLYRILVYKWIPKVSSMYAYDYSTRTHFLMQNKHRSIQWKDILISVAKLLVSNGIRNASVAIWRYFLSFHIMYLFNRNFDVFWKKVCNFFICVYSIAWNDCKNFRHSKMTDRKHMNPRILSMICPFHCKLVHWP